MRPGGSPALGARNLLVHFYEVFERRVFLLKQGKPLPQGISGRCYLLIGKLNGCHRIEMPAFRQGVLHRPDFVTALPEIPSEDKVEFAPVHVEALVVADAAARRVV